MAATLPGKPMITPADGASRQAGVETVQWRWLFTFHGNIVFSVKILLMPA